MASNGPKFKLTFMKILLDSKAIVSRHRHDDYTSLLPSGLTQEG
jgi:hypothetical protein